MQAVRSGKWKLHFHHNYPKPDPAGADGKPGKYKNLQIGPALFDLQADIGETRNVAAEHPEVVARLQLLAETCREDLGDLNPKRAGKNVRPAGQVEPQN